MMTQSMDPAHLAARLDNNTTPTVLTQPCNADPLTTQELMTASLDPSMLVSHKKYVKQGVGWTLVVPDFKDFSVEHHHCFVQIF